jgi:phospholipase/carboxylesterase
MNRISSLAVLPKSLPAPSKNATIQIEQSIIRRSSDSGNPHTLFAPLHYERNYAYPLVVWLHGQAGDERQLQKIMPLVSMRNYVAVGIRGPVESPLGRGYFWPRNHESTIVARQRVFDAIDVASEKFNINPERIFIAGYQCGGTMALRVALSAPQMFGGALSIGGAFPAGQSPLASLAQARKLPLFLAHCRDSQNYTVDQVCEELRLFHSAGLAVTVRQYPCGDELTTQMLHDADVWMMERVTGMVSSESQNALPRDVN